jgi:hypothetical protein
MPEDVQPRSLSEIFKDPAAELAPIEGGDGTNDATPIDPANPANPGEPAESIDPAEPAEGDEGDQGDDQGDDESTITDEDLVVWKEVDRLRGTEIPVEYGAVHPNSAEGILLREKAIQKWTVDQWVQELATTDKRGYAYLLHRQAGGRDEDFFNKPTPTLPPYDTFKESIDLQKNLLIADYTAKGIDPEIAEVTVEKLIEKGKLFETAEKVYNSEKSAEDTRIATTKALLDKQQADYTARVTQLDQTLNSTIEESLSIKVPDAKKAGFTQFVRGMIQETEGADGKPQFVVVQPIEAKEMDKLLQGLYFQFVGGDLNQVIQRKAKTAYLKRIQTQVDKTKQKPNAQGNRNPQAKTMGEI